MATQCPDYNFSEIEPHWQRYWDEHKTWRAEDRSDLPKYYVLDMFPYPSGAGLHIGHPEGYTGTDILARYQRARGRNVLHPMGWDAFGLPTEQFAIQTGAHPRDTSRRNIDNFRRQIKSLGFYYDWDREVDTTDPAYFRWTQWIFLQLFKKGLAYVDERPVWWCEALGTVLANEEVIDGRSERGNHPVVRRSLRQWVLRITAYAEDLLNGLKDLDWPDSTKRMQEAWIGRSEGAEIRFDLESLPGQSLEVFTTRPDTLFGATYMVVAPEHPLVPRLTAGAQRAAVEAYVGKAAAKSDLERTDLAKDKSGVFTGSFALHPVTGSRLPVWVADYVLLSYGTGAIMAVPAHDQRDYDFALTFDLPVQQVIEPADHSGNGDAATLPFLGEGRLVHSDGYTGLDWAEAKARITADLEAAGKGRARVQYKLRDWLFSRQRYWGEPFPIVWVSESDFEAARALPEVAPLLPAEPVVYREKDIAWYALPLPDAALPLELPEVESYHPSGSGESPLARATDWLDIWFHPASGRSTPASGSRPEGSGWIRARRETNTMPQWAGSCWYYLRYLDPKNPAEPFSPEAEAYWQTPDLYVGGAEHAVLHLLYARFWHKVLHDLGVVRSPEPFRKLFHQGIILGEDGSKMSKSLGNVVNPDEIVKDYGADTLRLYLMFLGPLEAMKPWNPKGIEGVHRFLRKVWRDLLDPAGRPAAKLHDGPEDHPATERLFHETIKKVTEDIENLRFNTAISQMMVFANHLQKVDRLARATASGFVQLIAPFAPHFGEELWERLGGAPSVTTAPWPAYDPAKLVTDEVKVVFQVNGKVRGDGFLPREATEADAVAAARAHPRVAPHLDGKALRKTIYVPGRILNLVVSG